jgi:RsiW-degrading membrane proteinase PrsW (M82 family)
VNAELLARAPIALLPVLAFLAVLVYLDSFKLVNIRTVLVAMLVGACAAGVSYGVNVAMLPRLDMEFVTYTRYVSPFVEEILKGLALVYLIRTRRLGTLVDAAIFGFAIGTGFALIENLYYLLSRPDAHVPVQVIRGFGTAIMHGGATAIFAIVAVAVTDKRPEAGLAAFLPGLLAAAVMHSIYNHLLVRPVLATLGILVLLPPVVYFVFEQSEKSLRDWLEKDLDSDVELLRLINSGEFAESHAGQYLHSLTASFHGAIVADMLCYLRLHVELAMRAKGILLMRESGIEAGIDDEVKEQLTELRYLERSIGRTGQLAVRPILQMTSKDLWQIYMLER